MRKKIISQNPPTTLTPEDAWLTLETTASVELTSEDPAHPIEQALTPEGAGYVAATPGAQTIRVLFDSPQRLRRIFLLFIEASRERTQQFVLRWSSDGRVFTEIVRQQWNFNSNATHQTEDYRVDLAGVSVLELIINPDLQDTTQDISLAHSPQAVLATLAAMRLA